MASSEMAKSDGEQDPSPGENILVWESAEIVIVIKGTLGLVLLFFQYVKIAFGERRR